jgi:hypothetical protein
MKFLVTFEVFDTIVGDGVRPLRAAFGKQLDYVIKSGKMITGGMLADRRGGFFILEAETGFELQSLFGEGMLDHCHVECHAIYEFEELMEFFKKSAAEQGG